MIDRWLTGFFVMVYVLGFVLGAIIIVPPVAFILYVFYQFMTL